MSDLPIASAAALTGATLASNDVLPVLDVSASAGSKGSKITVGELFTGRTATDLTANKLTLTALAANAAVLASTGYSLTGSNATSMVNLAGTWNTSGAPTGIKVDITDTASDNASLLMDLQINSSSKFRVTKSGVIDYNVPVFTDFVLLTRQGTPLIDFYGLAGVMQIQSGLYASGNIAAAALLKCQTGLRLEYYNGAPWGVINPMGGTTGLNNGFQVGDDHATTPTAQTIKAHNVTTGTGASLTLAGGKGSVAGGAVVLATSASTGTATPRLTIDSAGLGTFSGAAFSLINSTAASAGVQSASPSMVWTGQGWKTDATAGSQTVAWRTYAQPVQGTSEPSCDLVFGAAINGGSYLDVMTLKSGGQIVGCLSSSVIPTFSTPNGHGIGDFGPNGCSIVLNGSIAMDFANNFVGLPNGISTLLFGRFAGFGADAYSPQLGRDEDNVLAQKNGTNAQGTRVYNTFTSSTNYERFSVDWITTSNRCVLSTEKGSGGGTLRGMTLGAAATNPLSVYGVTPVVQASAITAPSGGAVQDAESRAAISDLITALKNFGITA